ncbi:Neurofilament light polypeptide like [Actinidia chinensis var. chinensis]|uniref:Neurofilament light polypeptide like n=1 Tax=Actinidia chinensis var. chinensis TaxID=1590841 RepID=A0A2R6PQ72_ACTCC|nr:Neurofilament light polypeptide like [Actinidia chinensis var. chinensis]
MKTVSGQIISTKAISLSKAAKVLSNFVAAETGASDAVSAYLRRASASFDELVQFHKDLKSSKSDRKLKSANSEGPVKYEKISEVEDSGGSYSVREKHNNNKKSEIMKREGGGSVVAEEGNRNRHRKNVEGNDESEDQSSLKKKKKKKKRRRIEGEED